MENSIEKRSIQDAKNFELQKDNQIWLKNSLDNQVLLEIRDNTNTDDSEQFHIFLKGRRK